MTFANTRVNDLDEFRNLLVEIEEKYQRGYVKQEICSPVLRAGQLKSC
jgi:hypothetical protein